MKQQRKIEVWAAADESSRAPVDSDDRGLTFTDGLNVAMLSNSTNSSTRYKDDQIPVTQLHEDLQRRGLRQRPEHLVVRGSGIALPSKIVSFFCPETSTKLLETSCARPHVHAFLFKNT